MDGRTEKSKLLLANDYKLRVTNIKKKLQTYEIWRALVD